MPKLKLYHGTSYENFESILKNGFSPEENVWNCASYQETYFWNPERLVEHGEAEDQTEAQERAVQMAFESAQIAAALLGSTRESIVVLELEVDADNVFDDDSCQNMDVACCVNNSNLKTSDIKAYYTSPYYPDLRVFYLSGVRDNEWIRLDALPMATQSCVAMLPHLDGMWEILMDSIDPVRVELEMEVQVCQTA